MKFCENFLRLLLCVCFSYAATAQTPTTIKGSIKNNTTHEKLSSVSVIIKGTSVGDYSDDNGNFKFTTVQSFPLTLLVTSVGYAPKEIKVNSASQNIDVLLEPSYVLGQDIVVAASRLPERILESPVTIERLSAANLRNAPGANYYDALANLKGVDINTSSLTFKTPSTRGFNGSGNLRFNQLVDGMDNTAPALNFSVGSMIGLTELDVDNMELLPGASSALYGSGGMNGTLLISSKDPFKYQGLSFQVKQGVMHINDSRHAASPYYDWSFRWGKKVSDKFAFKIGASYVKADDWQANDSTDLLRNNVLSTVKLGTRTSDPNYDGVNIYGDEASSSMNAVAQAALYQAQLPAKFMNDLNKLIIDNTPYNEIKKAIAGDLQNAPYSRYVPYYVGYATGAYGNQAVSRTGYMEKDVVNYNTYNIKFSGGLYYKISSDIMASLTGNWGMGTTVYTGADRYALKNFKMGQYRLEVKAKNWFIRGYTTQENSGDSYASTITALAINNAWKPNANWFAQYTGVYADTYLTYGPTSAAAANAAARGFADNGRFLPGTKEYNDAFNKSVKTPIGDGGSQFADHSSLYQGEGQLNLSQYVKVVEVLVGASYRLYRLNSKGTIFDDADGPINIGEFGSYIQLKRAFFDNVLNLTAAGRYDKNQNFNGRFTPRVTASIKLAKDNNIRLSYQEAYRFPTNQDQYINLYSPGSILIGGLAYFSDKYQFTTNPVYTSESIVAYRASLTATTPANPSLLQVAHFTAIKPETMKSFEIGYRGIITKNLLIDAYWYSSKYKDFIARSAVARGASGDASTSQAELLNPFSSTNYSFVVNSPTPVKGTGWGLGLDYQIGHKGYKVSANVYTDELNDVANGLITFFNTPKYRYNLGFANANAYQGFGFNVIYKWQDNVNWQGTFGSGEIPSFGTVDAQVSYKITGIKSLIKLGATNLFNSYYRNAFGNPYVGGLYYVSFGYNVF